MTGTEQEITAKYHGHVFADDLAKVAKSLYGETFQWQLRLAETILTDPEVIAYFERLASGEDAS
jgi:hypothetical protein